MALGRPSLLLDTLRRLIRRSAQAHILRVVAKARAEDVAETFASLTHWEARYLLTLLMEDVETASEIVVNLRDQTRDEIMADLTAAQIAQILEFYSADDAADLLESLPEEVREEVIGRLNPEDAEDVEELLAYGPETAGGIMSPDFLSISVESTCTQAIEAVQESSDAEVVFYIYCVNSEGTLVGVMSLRQIVVNHGDTPVKTIMNSDVVSVPARLDQEEVARRVARYDLLAIPVVDEFNKLAGVVTVDDVIDVIQDEATEDILKMVGAANPHGSAGRSVRARLPWILGSMVGGLATASVIGLFEDLAVFVVVAAFIPVVIGLGGNVGIQSATVVVRGLATGEVAAAGWRSVLRREVATGLAIALFCGTSVGIYSHFTAGPSIRLGVVVGSSVLGVMAMATVIGTLFPLLARRMNVDPAVATGPVLTALLDLVGVSLFLGVAALLLT